MQRSAIQRAAFPLAFPLKLWCGLLWLLLAACGGGSGPADPQAQQMIGAAGGEVVSPDGSMKLTIPAGALAAATQITVVEVSAANVPQHMKALAPARVFRLEPAGLQFAQPATARVTLPAGNTLAVLLLESNGTGAALDALSVEIGAASRVLSGQVRHFSNLAAVTVEGVTLELTVDKRNVLVGDQLRANATLSNGQDVSFVGRSPLLRRIGLAFTETGNSTSPSYQDIFPAGIAKQFVGAFTLRCDAPSSGLLEFELTVVDIYWRKLDLIFNRDPSKPVVGSVNVTARQDVVCDPADTVAGSIRTGLFPVPFGTGPDGIALRRGPFANLRQYAAAYIVLALSSGLVAIDTFTGLSALNMTTGSSDGPLGSNLLGAVAVSAAQPGPTAHAAWFGFSTDAYHLRNWDPVAGVWGLTELGINYPVLDAQHVAGDPDARRLIVSSPTRGIGYISQAASGFFNFEIGTTIGTTELGGEPRAAAQPFEGTDPFVVAAVVPFGSNNPRTSVVSFKLSRGANALFELFVLQGPPAYAVRCLQYGALPTLLATLAVCGVTQGDALHLFTMNRDNPALVPTVQKIPAAAGALGLEFGTRANGLPRGVVANYEANSLLIVDLAADGSVASNRIVPVPEGCSKPPHAVPFAHAGKDYVAGTCNQSDRYFVIEVPGS